MNENIGMKLIRLISAYRGKNNGKAPTEEQVRIFEEEYGILIQKKKTKTQDIGQATYTATTQKCDEASDIIHELVTDKKRQNQILSYQE